jgi:hypothetical protein
LAFFRSTSNRIEQIVPHERWLRGFDASTDANLDFFLRRLAEHARVKLDYLELHFRRGFVDRVWATREMHRKNQGQLLEQWPIVPQVEIYDDAEV